MNYFVGIYYIVKTNNIFIFFEGKETNTMREIEKNNYPKASGKLK